LRPHDEIHELANCLFGRHELPIVEFRNGGVK
jgi:hypothetical protein